MNLFSTEKPPKDLKPSETRISIEGYDPKLDKNLRKFEGALSDFIRILFGFK